MLDTVSYQKAVREDNDFRRDYNKNRYKNFMR